ncbi:MAG: magnesium transporter CorA family protein, partial [Armatimonadaceae bacterium]
MVTIHSYAADGTVVVSDTDTARGHVPLVPSDDGTLVWVDIEKPSDADWQWLAETFDFHPLAIEDARRQGQRAKMDVYDDHLFLSLKIPLPPEEPLRDIEDGAQELDLFVAEGLLVSVHPEPLPALAHVRTHRPSSRNPIHRRPGYLLYRLIDTLVDEFAPWMDALDSAIDSLETTAHVNNATPDLRSAVRLKKQLLILRQMAAPVRDLVNQLLRIDNPTLIDPALTPFLQDVYDHTLRLVEQVDLHRDILGNVVDLMMAQTSNHLNAVMKTLTS